MFCKNCGAQINEGANVCPSCGANLNESSFEKVGNFVDSVTDKVDAETNRVIGSVEKAFNLNQNIGGKRLLKTNRSLLVYILLSFLTCGIYNYFFIHSMAKDVNEACRDDSEKTPGVGMFILTGIIGVAVSTFLSARGLIDYTGIINAAQNGDVGRIVSSYSLMIIPMTIVSIITGIYPLYWRFKLGNKLQRNGQQYGILINENGSTVLIWDIIGILCCCIGSFYALYVLIKNTNTVCTAYNSKYVLGNNN